VLNRLLVGDGVVGVGELRYLWERGVVKRQDCSCGNPWDACPLWHPVVGAVLAAQEATDPVATARQLHHDGRRAGRKINDNPTRTDGVVGRYAAVLGQLYTTVAQQTGARLIVDSSKDPAHALLARASGADVTVVHLVRDPRAVAWSHGRAKAPPAGAAANVTEKHGTFYVATRWTIRNAFIDRSVQPDLRIRYEDMVADTEQVTKAIFAAAGTELPPVHGGVEHLIAGNPNRFDTERPKTLREDVEWRTAQPDRHKRLTKLIAGRLMRRYGYTDS
jgi:hypothetical protein